MSKKCKNPECQKEISEEKIYCNEECLKRFLELKKEAIGKPEKELREKDRPQCVLPKKEKLKKQKKENVEKTEKQKSLIPLIKCDTETIYEIQEICDTFGFKQGEGLITGSHNATILGYLRQHQEETMKTTVDKLTWICHMTNRSVKENYLAGIEAFGIIETFTNEFGAIKWRWVGIKALRNDGSGKK